MIDDRNRKAARGVGVGIGAGRGARAAQNTAGERRDEGDGDHQGQQHRDRNGDRDIAEQLAGLELHHQDGYKHKNRRQRRDEHRAPHLAGALIGGFGSRQAALAQAVDVLQHDDGGIDHHADGEGEAGQGHHIDRAPEERHGDERAYHRNRNRDGDDHRGAERAQKQH